MFDPRLKSEKYRYNQVRQRYGATLHHRYEIEVREFLTSSRC